jgi:hypothetical protein
MANPEFWEQSRYRSNLANELSSVRFYGKSMEATEILRKRRQTLSYQIEQRLHQKPDILLAPLNEKIFVLKKNYDKNRDCGFYHSNEFYLGLAQEIRGLGGVGIAVGPDQGLDFYTMANLDEVYNIDVDSNTNTVTRLHMECGTRFNKLFGRYPSTKEFIGLYDDKNWPTTVSLLSKPSGTYNFSPKELEWLAQIFSIKHLDDTSPYLRNKVKFYGNSSWIGTDDNLRKVIQGYEEGKIHVVKGDIVGKTLHQISKRIKKEKQSVSLIYTSNAFLTLQGSFKPIDTFRKLPITDRTQVIFSNKVNGFENVGKPESFDQVIDWTLFVFNLKDVWRWPNIETVKDDFTDKKINQGCYRLIQKQTS